jgi:chromosome segregation ATPase
LSAASVRQFEQIAAALVDAAAKMEQAQSLDKNDVALDEALRQIKLVQTQKTGQLESARADLSNKSKALEQAIAQTQTMEQNVTASLAALESGKQQLAAQISEHQKLEAADLAAQTALKAASEDVEQVRQQLASIQASLAAAKGLSP